MVSYNRQSIVASLVAYGTNVGLGKMGEISDLNYQTLYTAANSFLRPETLRDSNDRVSNAMAKLPIFRHYDIDEEIHSSSDGQKFETQFSTIRQIASFTEIFRPEEGHLPVYAGGEPCPN